MPKNKKPNYKLNNGTLVAGVTTVLQTLAKPALIPWAWKLGKDGIDYREYLDEKANIGTLAHSMILEYFKDGEFIEFRGWETNDYSEEEFNQARKCFDKFAEWRGVSKKIKPLVVEKPFVSEVFEYGGTPDFYGEIDGKRVLCDFKTNPNVYDEMKIQLGAYYMLLKEHQLYVDKACIVNIPIEGKKARETFISIPTLEVGFKIFQHCLEIYQLKRRLK